MRKQPLQPTLEKTANLILSVTFLLVILGIMWLVGSKRIDLGFDPSLVFLIYVLAGLLIAFACFGVLTSTGEIAGKPYGVHVRLGGSIVAAVVVAGGGSLYELYVRPAAFSTRIMFYDGSATNQVRPGGSFRLFVGSGVEDQPIQSDGTVLFQNLHRNEALRYELISQNYAIDPSDAPRLALVPDELVALKVVRKNPFAPYDPSKLKIELNLTKSELPFRSYSADVTDGTLSDVFLLQPRKPQTITMDVVIPSDFRDLTNLGLEAWMTLQYADPNKADGGSYSIGPVPFDETRFPPSN